MNTNGQNENHERIKSNPIWAKPLYLRIQHLFDPQEHPKRLFFSRRKLLLKTKCFPLWHHNTRRRFFCRVEYYLRIGFLQSRQFLTKKKNKNKTTKQIKQNPIQKNLIGNQKNKQKEDQNQTPFKHLQIFFYLKKKKKKKKEKKVVVDGGGDGGGSGGFQLWLGSDSVSGSFVKFTSESSICANA